MRHSLAGRTALVTGAAKRIGRAIALQLADQQADVLVHYRSSADAAKDLVRELVDRDVRAWSVQADLEDEHQTETLISRSLELAGSLDILINNAAIFGSGGVADISFPDVVRHLRINAWAPLVLSRQFAHRAGRGQIINLLDARLRRRDHEHIAYYLSKQALATLTKITALEFAPEIRVNAIAPDLILPPPDEGEEYLDRLAEGVPLERHGSPADIANAVLFLLRSPFVTGEIIQVDGGRYL